MESIRRRAVAAGVCAALALAGAGCDGHPTPPPAPPPLTPGPPAPGTPNPPVGTGNGEPTVPVAVLVGAGDIASCTSTGDSATAALLARTAGTVFTLGDDAYANGSPRDFARCYGPTWGRFKGRTRPVIGNHEYHTGGAAGYFGYFGGKAGKRGEGWYSYQAGAWHVVVLNSNCAVIRGGCRAGSPQERWLRADLARARSQCTVAMWHHPLFTSGRVHAPETAVRPLVRALYAAGAELLLTGHNHQYERFAPLDPAGRPDAARGIRSFVVGTGGASHYAFARPARGSEVRNGDTYGVLRLRLRPGAYEWRFLPVAGHRFTDSGQGRCH